VTVLTLPRRRDGGLSVGFGTDTFKFLYHEKKEGGRGFFFFFLINGYRGSGWPGFA